MQRNSKSGTDSNLLPIGEAPRSIVLVGLMGAGKTTVGRRLARRLGLPFVDADAEIEAAAGMTIAEIFDKFDEAYFRDGERRVIARIIANGPVVLATGGGAFMDPATRALVKDRGISIWLDAGIDTLVERVARRDTRPLLLGGDQERILRELAQRRAPVYALADIHITSDRAPHDHSVRAILAALERRAPA